MRLNQKPRRGISLVEFALVSSLGMLLLLGLLAGCLGIFRYQQVAALAREAARYASVHGSDYTKDASGHPNVSKADIQNALASRATLLDLSKLGYSITWAAESATPPLSNSVFYTNPVNGFITQNTVAVTVTYEWKPEVFFGKSIILTSTSVATMSY